MAKQRKPKKPLQPGNLIFLAVASYVLGFPLWVTVALVAGSFIVWRLRKQDKALEHLPLPPQHADNAANPQGDSLSESLGHTWGHTDSPDTGLPKDIGTSRPPAPTASQSSDRLKPEERLASQYQNATLDALPVYTQKDQATPRTITPSPGPKHSPAHSPAYGTWQSPSHAHPIAHSLRSRTGLRQAIVAMTVLGAPRSLDPYRPEPQKRVDSLPSTRGGTT